MKYLILSLLISSQVFAATNQTKSESQEKVGSPPNAVSRGQSTMSGVSDSPTGTTPKQAQEYRNRAESMGGAPNAGGGMGTGTGAGSTVGKDLDDDNISVSSGALGGENTDEDRE